MILIVRYVYYHSFIIACCVRLLYLYGRDDLVQGSNLFPGLTQKALSSQPLMLLLITKCKRRSRSAAGSKFAMLDDESRRLMILPSRRFLGLNCKRQPTSDKDFLQLFNLSQAQARFEVVQANLRLLCIVGDVRCQGNAE